MAATAGHCASHILGKVVQVNRSRRRTDRSDTVYQSMYELHKYVIRRQFEGKNNAKQSLSLPEHLLSESRWFLCRYVSRSGDNFAAYVEYTATLPVAPIALQLSVTQYSGMRRNQDPVYNCTHRIEHGESSSGVARTGWIKQTSFFFSLFPNK